MVIDEAKLEKLLAKAYEEGWYGSKELASEAVNKIIRDFKNEQKSSACIPKKKAVKKKASQSSQSLWGDHLDQYFREAIPNTYRTAGGEHINANSNSYLNPPRRGRSRRVRESVEDHRAALESAMHRMDSARMDSARVDWAAPPSNPCAEIDMQGNPVASQEAIDDLNAWVGGVDPGEQIPNDGPEETLE